MKRFKLLIGACVVVLLLVVAAVGALFLKPVQKAIFLNIASSSEGVQDVTLNSIQVGFDGIELEQLAFKTPAGTFTIGSASLDAPLMSFINQPRTEIRNLVLGDVVVDLSDAKPGSEEETREPSSAAVTLPALSDFTVFETVSILQSSGDVQVILSEDEVIDLDLKLVNVLPGQKGKLTFGWDWAQPSFLAESAKERAVFGNLSADIALDATGALTSIDLDTALGAKLDAREGTPVSLSMMLKDGNDTLLAESQLNYLSADEQSVPVVSGSLTIPANLERFIFRGSVAGDTSEMQTLWTLLGIADPGLTLDTELAAEFYQKSGRLISELKGRAGYGDLQNRFDLVINGNTQPQFQGRVTGFWIGEAEASRSSVELSQLDAKIAAGGAFSGTGNAIFKNAGKSERLKLEARASADPRTPVKLTIDSEVLSISLLQAVAEGIAGSLPEPMGNDDALAPITDNPFLLGRPVHLLGSVGRLVIQEPWSLNDVRLDTRIENGILDLRQADFSFLSGRFANAGKVGFENGLFNLNATSALRDLTVQNAMTTLGFDPIVKTTLQGDVTWGATAATMPELIEKMGMSWSFKASEGSIDIPQSNILRQIRGKAQLGNLVGSILPGQRYLGDFSKILDYADVIELEELSFDGQRGADGKVAVDKLELKGADFYAQVAGGIRSGSWSDILNSALRLQLNMGAKGDVAALAKNIGLSEGRARDGYELWGKVPFSVTGTLERLDFRSLQTWALNALQGKAVSGLIGEKPAETGKPTDPKKQEAEEIKRQATGLLNGLLNGL